MLRALWILTRFVLVVALGVWLAVQPGRTSLSGFGYNLEIQTGLLIFAGLVFAYIFARLYQILIAILRTPKNISMAMEVRHQDSGVAAVSQSLSALAAGDTNVADRQTNRAQKLLKNDHGLVAMLRGMTAKLKGDPIAAENAFRELLNTSETAFLGVRGLLQLALERRQPDQALYLARQAHSMHPKQGWIMDVLFALEAQMRHWDEAMKISNRALRAKVKTPDQHREDMAAVLLARAQEAKISGHNDQAFLLTREAYDKCPYFLPAAIAYLPFLIRRHDRKKAIQVIEKSWARMPHPELQDAWEKLMPEGKTHDHTGAQAYLWLERLANVNPDNEASHIMLSQAALSRNLPGEARAHAEAALGIRQSQSAYAALIKVEISEGHHNAADALRARQVTAAPSRMWVEMQSGYIYQNWQPFALPSGRFNTITWDIPQIGRRADNDAGAGKLGGGTDALQFTQGQMAIL